MNNDTQQTRLTTEDVIRAEFNEINLQRGQRIGDDIGLVFEDVFPAGVKEGTNETVAPTKLADFLKGPVGLCFSGGGIRSATFNLGVLQGLREAGLLKFIDYLSTVSGGGYIGSWFTATNHRLAKALEQGEEAGIAGELERNYNYLDENKPAGSPFIHHLRQYSRYMAPKAGITSGDTWTMISTWLRNTTLVQTMVISCIGALVCLVAALPLIFRGLVARVAAPAFIDTCQFISDGAWWLTVIFAQIACIWGIVMVCRWGIQCVQDDCRDLKALGNRPGLSGVLLAGLLTFGSFLASVQLFRMHEDGLRVLGVSKPQGRAPWMDDFRSWFYMDPTVTLMVIVVSLLSVWMAWLSLRPSAQKSGVKKTIYFWVLGTLFQFFAGMVLVHGVCSFFGTLIAGRMPLNNASALSWTTILGPILIMLGYCSIQVLAIGIIGRHMDEKMREWWGRAGAWVLMGATLILLASLVVIAGPVFVDWLFSDQLKGFLGSSVVIGWMLTLVVGVLAGNSAKTGKAGGGGTTELLAANLPLIFLVGLLLIISYIVRWMLLPEYGYCTSGFLVEAYPLDKAGAFFGKCICLGSILLALGLLFINRLDLNEFSMNPFYRNRLVRCYLGGSRLMDDRQAQPVTAFDFADDLPMSEIRSVTQDSKFKGPFHIVNTAINSGASAGLDVQDRSAESFIFTPLHAGFDYWRKALGKKTGPEVEKRICYHPAHNFTMEKGWTLGTALSVSGAAASPNSGYHTSPLVAFMLTLFNARLGWWTPHPGKKEVAMKERPEGRLGFFYYLMAELTGSATLDSDFVYLSDGGHFENLGLYELVRRRCSVIIVGDGECDPTYNFQALGVAIRRCRVDFGVCIEIETHLIRPDPATGLSSSHGVVGKIIYPGGREGILIYLKSSVTGDESLDVRQYRGENPLFPHESTGDQFYSESQFESYRCLGKHVALEMLAPTSNIHMTGSLIGDHRMEVLAQKKKEKDNPITPDQKHEFSTIIDKLAAFWIPPPPVKVSSFVQHTEALISIWRQAAADPALAELDQMLIRGWQKLQPLATPPTTPPASPQATRNLTVDRRATTYLCLQVIQLMENVFLDLDFVHHSDHADHTGWMDIFKDWAANPVMKQVWEQSHHTYGTRFQTFWKQQLDQRTAMNPELLASTTSAPT